MVGKLFVGCNSSSWFAKVPQKVLYCFYKIHFWKINCSCISVFWKILPQLQNSFFDNLFGYLKGYPCKLLLLFGTVHLTRKLPYFDNFKLMYLTLFLLKILWRSWFWGKCLYSRFKKCLPILVDTFLPKRGVNQIIFLLRLHLWWMFVLTGLYFNFCW